MFTVLAHIEAPEQDVNIKPDCRQGAAVRQGLEQWQWQISSP
jgi:hypothetical protein